MKRLLTSLIVACATLIVCVGTVEWHWRNRGYLPGIIDSQDLWAQQRARLTRTSKKPIALLGASRTLYSVDLSTLRQRLPAYEPVMLALDANPAMATLRDLAADKRFDGVVICDVDGIGLWRATWDYQQPHVDHFHQQWTISRDSHLRLLTRWQQHAVIARSDFSLLRSLVRWWNKESDPFRPYMHMTPSREGHIDYSLVDTSVHRKELEAHLAKHGGKLPGPKPEAWRKDLDIVKGWVQAIEQRGGRVIFYSSPISGLRRQVEEDTYPRDEFWNHLAAITGAASLHADDVPALRDFPLPDESHIDYRDKARYTNLLIDALIERELL